MGRFNSGILSLFSLARPVKGRTLPAPPFFSWATWCGIVLLVFVVSLVYLAVAPALAQHEGEQTANLLPPETDLYLTVNLRPGPNQVFKFWQVANNWWETSRFQEQWQGFIGGFESTTGINILENILPWLGPEIAAGVQDIASPEPGFFLLIGTMDRSTSDPLFAQYVEERGVEDGVAVTTDTYQGIEITVITTTDELGSEQAEYYALTGDGADIDGYIMVSSDMELLTGMIDRLLAGGASLADTVKFQAARAALPSERVGFLYVSVAHIWEGLSPQMGEGMPDQVMLDLLTPQIPPFVAASAAFVDNGVKFDVFSPQPAAGVPLSSEVNPLGSAALVPGDTLLFFSTQDLNSQWQHLRTSIEENMDQEWAQSLAQQLSELEMGGIDLDPDVFGWMTGEVALALITPPAPNTVPDLLLLFEVADPAAVEESLAQLLTAWNAATALAGYALEAIPTTIGGVDAILLENDSLAGSGLSPGYLFLDSYLVFGSTVDSLTAAVVAQGNPELSLSGTAEYQQVLDSLPQDKMDLAYLNIRGVMSTFLSGMSEEERWGFQENVGWLLPPLRAVGVSSWADEAGVSLSAVLYIERPPTAEVWGQVFLQGRWDHSGALYTADGAEAVTNSEGWFTVADIPPGTYSGTAMADAPGYLWAELPYEDVVVEEGDTLFLPDVMLLGGDADNSEAIDSLDLDIVAEAFNTSPPQDERADINADGVVDIYDLVLVGSNFTRASPQPWALQPTRGSISGTVYEEDGFTPIEGAWVDVYDAESGEWMGGAYYTDETGSYTVEGLEIGDYKVIAFAWGYSFEYYQDAVNWESATLVTVVSGEETWGIDFTLEIGGIISGTVYEEDGVTPIAGAWVDVYDAASGWWVAGAYYTDETGSYRMEGLPPGDYKVQASADSYVSEYFSEAADWDSATVVTVVSGEDTSGLDFTLALLGAGGSISGFVYEEDGFSPIAGAWVEAYDAVSEEWVNWSYYTDETGSYMVEGLEAGDYRVQASAWGYSFEYYQGAADWGSATVVTVVAGEETSGIDFTLTSLAPGSLSGTVYEEDGVTPVAGAWVDVYDAVSEEWVNWSYYTDETGSYMVEGLEAGDYKVVASADGYVPEYYSEAADWGSATVIVVEGQETPGIDFTLATAEATLSVSISGFAFSPSQLTVQAGDTVVWTNEETSVPHTVTSTTGVFDSGYMVPGDSFSYTFDTPGTYNYRCTLHTYMTGVIIVG